MTEIIFLEEETMCRKIITGIYAIRNKINSKIYIGSSYNIHERWSYHKNVLNKKKHSEVLQNDWILYGKNCFEFIILEETELNDFILADREQFYLNKFESYTNQKGYNINKKATRPRNPKLNSILQYTVHGDFVKEWSSFRDIQNILQIETSGIRQVCSGNRKMSHGFCWFIKNGDIQKNIDVSHIIIQKKSICQFSLNGILLNKWDSIYQASIETKISEQSISSCCRKKLRSAGNFVWRFKDNVKGLTKIHVSKKKTTSKQIVQFDLFGNFVNEFPNVMYATNSTNINSELIKQACRNKTATSNFFWRYKEEIKNIKKINVKNTFVKNWPILQYTANGRFIKEFKSISELCKELTNGIKKTTEYICSGKCKILKNFLFFKKSQANILLQIEV